jgi:CheY-like chemotaxis protein
LFEPFFSKKRASERAGSGLGLAIVHGVVKEHAGYVDVTSDLGKGTTFTLYVPLTSEPARVSLQPVAVRRGKARVLIIDDDALLLRTGLRVLKPLGYQVVTCDSGKRALEQFTQAAGGACPHDLVIVDMILNEELDGLQLLERIRDLFPGLKAILASGNAGNRRVEAAVHGGLTWLPKPYTADALARSVQLALEV